MRNTQPTLTFAVLIRELVENVALIEELLIEKGITTREEMMGRLEDGK